METLRRNGIKLVGRLSSDRLFYVLLVCEILLFTWLNWENKMMYGILHYYEDFANFFLSGFDLNYPFKSGADTFPMWGYGFILAITKNKLFVIFCQQAFTVFTIYKIQDILKSLGMQTMSNNYLRLFFLLGFSWFLFHSAYWPYSFASNLLILSMLYLSRAFYQVKLRDYIVSGIMYGLTLNFRSDYLYYLFALFLLLLIHLIFKNKQEIKYAFIWILTCLFFLIPWALYTHQKTGSYLLNSTNGGHVLYISLGQLPNNIWGITPLDEDPKMRSLVDSLVSPGVKTVTYAADRVLKEQWKENIAAYPGEYLKKCGYNLLRTFTRPFTHGEIYQKFIPSKEAQRQLKNDIKRDIKNQAFISLIRKMGSKKYAGFILPFLLNIAIICLFIFLLICLLRGMVLFGKDIFTNWILLVCYSIIGYQLALQTFAYYNPNYHTNVLIYYYIIAALVMSRQSIGNQKPQV